MGGSGKGFALKKFIRSESYQVVDVDEMKQAILRLVNAGKLKDVPDQIKKIAKDLKAGKTPLKNPDNVDALHQYVSKSGFEDKMMKRLEKSILSSDPKRKKNIVFDKTGKSIKQVKESLETLSKLGYKPTDIAIVWAFANFGVAIDNNRGRARVVPEDILLQAHEGASVTMFQILKDIKTIPTNIFDGEIYIINADRDVTITVKSKNAKSASIKNIKDFEYFKVKTSGKPVNFEGVDKAKIMKWFVDKMPCTAKTKEIFKFIKDKYGIGRENC